MNLPAILDVAIGLVLVFFLMATISSVLAEWIAAIGRFRHRLLKSSVDKLLDPELHNDFWNHPLISSLCHETRDKKHGTQSSPPAYLGEATFATVVMDLATGSGAKGGVPATRTALGHAFDASLPRAPALRNLLQALLRHVPDAADLTAGMHAAVAAWFKEAMERTTGSYRRRMQRVLAIVAGVLVLLVNCDAMRIAHVLYQSPAVRAQAAEQAAALLAGPAAADPHVATDLKEQLEEDVAQLRELVELGFPLGWAPTLNANFLSTPNPTERPGYSAWLAKIVGLAVSVLAVLIGAPFWFDLLGRVVKLRSSAGSPAEQPKATGTATIAVAATAPATPTG